MIDDPELPRRLASRHKNQSGQMREYFDIIADRRCLVGAEESKQALACLDSSGIDKLTLQSGENPRLTSSISQPLFPKTQKHAVGKSSEFGQPEPCQFFNLAGSVGTKLGGKVRHTVSFGGIN